MFMNKINLRLKPYDLFAKTLVGLSMTLILVHAHAAEESPDAVEDYRRANDLVELHYPVEIDLPYREHRGTHGFMFSVNYENVMLDRYVSVIDNTTFYQDMFGETEFPVYNLNLSYKYNFALGSLTANFGVGYGSIKEDATGVEHTLSLTKYMVSGTYIMDALFAEPYVAPYGTFGVMRLGLTEANPTQSVNGNIDMLYFMQAGLLIQLNWLEDGVARRSLVESGLENTYLDVFVSKYEPSSDINDPDTSTDYMLGAGLRLEY